MQLKERLAQAIEVWLSQREKRNLNTLARLTGVSYSTIRRVLQREADTSRNIALRIAQVTMLEEEFEEFVDHYCSDLKRIFVKGTHVDDSKSELEYFTDERYFPLLLLASAPGGTSHEQVSRQYGVEAEAHFDDLVNSGLLVRVGKNWKVAEDYDNPSMESARKILGIFLKIYQGKNDRLKHSSTAYAAWESLTPAAAREIYEINSTYWKRISSIVTNKDNRGEVLLYTGLIHNVIKGGELVQ